MLTVDLQVLGQRHRDIKNGMTVPPEIRIANVIDVATKPAWAWSVLKGRRKTFGNLAGHVKGMVKMEIDASGTEEFDGKKVEIAVKILRRVASDLIATPVR